MGVKGLVEGHAVQVGGDLGVADAARGDDVAVLALDGEHLEHLGEVLVVEMQVHDQVIVDLHVTGAGSLPGSPAA